MQTRHRAPVLFTLYMVDVFCCALGCVILLWLASVRDAQRSAAAHEQTAKLLAEARLRLASAQGELAAVQSARVAIEQDRDRVRKKLHAAQQEGVGLARLAAEAEKRHALARGELQRSRALADQLRAELKQARARDAELAAGLRRKTKDYQALAGKLNAGERALRDARQDLQDRERALGEASATVSGLTDRLKKTEERVEELEQRADSLRSAARDYRSRLAALEGRSSALARDVQQRDEKLADAARQLRELEQVRTRLERQLEDRGKDLAAANRATADLGARAKALGGELLTARADADRRFAGLALTGRRVLFLVDVSGSMRKRDPATEDPKKWPLVCEALGRLMRSLPDLKQYQVIVFSDRFSYPLGRPGYWLDYDAKASVQATVERLKRVVPQGDTNLSAAFAEAFRYRPLDLDTIYLLSDGLPNLGDGLPVKSADLKETEKSLYLSRYVRQTMQRWWNRELPGRPRVRINAIGFYFDSPDVGAFLWALARENDGGFVGMSRP